MENLMLSWVANHKQWIEGMLLGAVLSNPGTCALILFNLVVKIPGVGLYIGKNPEKAKAWADGFDKKIDELVDKYASDQNASPPKS